MNAFADENQSVVDEPREVRQVFAGLNPILRALSFVPLSLLIFGVMGIIAIQTVQNFQVTYNISSQASAVTLWEGRTPELNFINDNRYFLPSELPVTDFSLPIRSEIWLPEAGKYEFLLDSDDASWLFLDGRQVLDNGGRHRMLGKSVEIELEPGFHRFEVDFRQYDLEKILLVRWRPPWKSKPEPLRPPYVYLPDTQSLPAMTLNVQRWLTFAGGVLLLVQLWALGVIVVCFPGARAKMATRLALILIIGLTALAQGLAFRALEGRDISEVHCTDGGLTDHFITEPSSLTLPIVKIFAYSWSSYSAAMLATCLCFVTLSVGIQYRLGKDFFSSRIAGLFASVLLAIIFIGMTLTGFLVIPDFLLFGSLLLLFGWRLCRQRKLNLLSFDATMVLILVFVALRASYASTGFVLGVVLMGVLSKYGGTRRLHKDFVMIGLTAVSAFAILTILVTLVASGGKLQVGDICWVMPAIVPLVLKLGRDIASRVQTRNTALTR